MDAANRQEKQTQLFIDAKSYFEGYLILKYGEIHRAKGVDYAAWLLLEHITAHHHYGRDKLDY